MNYKLTNLDNDDIGTVGNYVTFFESSDGLRVTNKVTINTLDSVKLNGQVYLYMTKSGSYTKTPPINRILSNTGNSVTFETITGVYKLEMLNEES